MGSYISSYFFNPPPIILQDQKCNHHSTCVCCFNDVKPNDDCVGHDDTHHVHKKCYEFWKKTHSTCPTCEFEDNASAPHRNLVVSTPTALASTYYMLSSLELPAKLAGAGFISGLFLPTMIGTLIGTVGRACLANTPTKNLKACAITVLSTACTAYFWGGYIIQANQRI